MAMSLSGPHVLVADPGAALSVYRDTYDEAMARPPLRMDWAGWGCPGHDRGA